MVDLVVPDHAETFYYAVAHRWGWSNGHQYVCGVGTSRDDVVEQAEAENYYRGGKYATVVYEVKVWRTHGVDATGTLGDHPELIPDWDNCREQIAYFPSSWGESEPVFNERIYAAESIGLSVMEAEDSGKAWLPAKGIEDPELRGTLHRVEVDLPVWLRTMVRRKNSETKALTAAFPNETAHDPFRDLRTAIDALADAESDPDWDLEGPALIAVENARHEVIRQALRLVAEHPGYPVPDPVDSEGGE